MKAEGMHADCTWCMLGVCVAERGASASRRVLLYWRVMGMAIGEREAATEKFTKRVLQRVTESSAAGRVAAVQWISACDSA